MEWIKVSDQKPALVKTSYNARSSNDVLAMTAGGYVGRCVFEVDIDDSSNQHWFEIGVDVVEGVEYWMPLPELPKDIAQ